MPTRLQERVAGALPGERDVMGALGALPGEAWGEAALTLAANLPAFDVVLAVSGVGETFGERLAAQAGVPLALARNTPAHAPQPPGQWRFERWTVERRLLTGRRRALLASALLADGVPELELAALALQAGLEVIGAACAVEFSTRGARSRLDMRGVRVHALLQLAHTPQGLQFERRGAGGDVVVPLP